ncbi:MAG: deoxyribodipyrimidine photo-lyase [Chitinispirillaceae bacterium]|nr:deoxyribodipyrimidine photo-lyase [Chitinispirillaceae bacterium]
MVHPARIEHLNRKPVRNGLFVVYWMQQSQRVEHNHALAYAIEQANELRVPLVVFFGLTANFPEANLRHYDFMIRGLGQVRKRLKRMGIQMVVRIVDHAKGVAAFARRASLVVTDRGYLRVQKAWRTQAAKRLACAFVQVETDVIVPVNRASDREEYAAATIRAKLHKRLAEFFAQIEMPRVKKDSLGMRFAEGIDLEDTGAVCRRLPIDMTVKPVTWIEPGEAAAHRMLDGFIATKLDRFQELRNDPSLDYCSNMSPYLHFGQIAAYEIAKRVLASGSHSTEAYLEELFVRRELAVNFVEYNPRYDSYACLPAWCRRTLEEHAIDEREYCYSPRELERGGTHDPCWNAAQKEIVMRGKMHGYMRMYWGKKLIEWSRTPARAFKTALRLNNRYSLDGRDPCGFTGVAWCFGKHDRPWTERAIFGKIRFMNDKGLERKFDIGAYVRRIEREWGPWRGKE